ncbi:MAG: PadR family transcriptional regulator [Candidatus Bathyarchaeota archaeon]|nr:PadR family transcriptional regulator [Candidatus Bathyarchaeota archaeon]
MAYERLVKKMTVENLWIYILSSLKLKPRYGYEIGRHIEKNYGFKLGKVTSYVILYRLVKEGLIILKEEKKDGFGPPRKYYAITDKGLKALRQGEKFLENMLDRIKKTQ